jgi:hypothetical protein
MPHQDLNFFTEPGCLLANYGKLADPGGQYYNLTYQRGVYNYPPGFFLILAAWIRLFGYSADSLLGYTHTIHTAFLVGMWTLLRWRYQCSKTTSALVLLAVFPFWHHGRPDLTAALFSLMAWLTLPDDDSLGRLVFSGCCLGATMLISPAFGIGTVSTLAILILVDSKILLRMRWRALAIWLGSAGATFIGVVAAVLSMQHSWLLAYIQFTTNLGIRGRELNVWPDVRTVFALTFSIIPFGVIALIPACFAVVAMWRERQTALWRVGLAFLGGTIAWFSTDKLQLLLDYHYMFPAKSVFLGLFFSQPKLPAWARSMPLVLLAVIGWYYQKSDFLYLTAPLRDEVYRFAEGVHLTSNAPDAAVDSLYFTQFYRPWRTLDYETLDYDYWEKYLDAIPVRFRNELLTGLARTPAQPSIVVTSAATAMRDGLPKMSGFQCAYPEGVLKPLRLLGRTWKLPANPYAMIVCTSSGMPAAVHDEQHQPSSADGWRDTGQTTSLANDNEMISTPRGKQR